MKLVLVVILAAAVVFLATYFDVFTPILSIQVRRFPNKLFAEFAKGQRHLNLLQLILRKNSFAKEHGLARGLSFITDQIPLPLGFSHTRLVCPIPPSYAQRHTQQELDVLKFKEGNYMFIEFRYWNAVLSYPNLIRAMHKLKKESRG